MSAVPFAGAGLLRELAFDAPAWLLLLPVAFAPLLRRRRALAVPSLAAASAAPRRLLVPPLLYALGLALLIAALAGPWRPLGGATPPPRGHLLLVFDTSASMGTPEGGDTRLAAATAATRGLLAGLPPLRIGVVRAAAEPSLAMPLTPDGELLAAALADLRVEPGERGATALGDGVALALRHRPERDALPAAILLVSDGRNNAGRLDLPTAGAAAAALDTPVFALGAGAGAPGDDALDEAALRALASRTGGAYSRVERAAALLPALRAHFPAAPPPHRGDPAAPVRRESLRRDFLTASSLAFALALLLAWGPLRVFP